MRLESEGLRSCINVFSEGNYKKVFMRIVEFYRDRREGASFYHLYKRERLLKSANTLRAVLRTLVSCGYVACVERSAETNSPKKRKDYIPTPLGAFMYHILKLSDIVEKLHSKYVGRLVFVEDGCKGLKDEECMKREIKKEIEKLAIERGFASISHFIEEFIDVGLYYATISMLRSPSHLQAFSSLITGVNTVIHVSTAPPLRRIKEIELMLLIKNSLDPDIRKRLFEIGEEALNKALGELQRREDFLEKLLRLSHTKCKGEVGEDLECEELNLLRYLRDAYLFIAELSAATSKSSQK
jgi:hypothetical protein